MKRHLLMKSILLLFALAVGSSSVWADDTYTKVTSVSDLDTDATYILADVVTSGNTSTAYAMGALNSNSRGTIVTNGLSVSGSSIIVASTATTKPIELTLTTSGDYYTISYGSTSTYLGYNSGTAFTTATTLPTSEADLKKYQWDIKNNTTYSCLLINNVNTTSRYIIRNGTSGISAYSNSNLSSYGKTTLYKKVVSSDPSSAATFANTTPSIIFPATNTYTQSATTASGYTGTVTYELTNNTAGATLLGTTVTVTQEGSVTVKATAPATTGYLASTASYTLTVTDSRNAPGLAYADDSQTVNVGEILSSPALTNPNSLSVTYESDDETVATVDASGNVTGVAIGTTTITAVFAGNDSYKPGSASYTINVTRAVPVGELLYESVSGYTSTSDATGELTTSSTNLDFINWSSFSKVYAGGKQTGDLDGHLKFGSSSAVGKAVTKSIALTGNAILTYKVMRFNADNVGELKVSVTGATATGDVDVTGTAAWVEKTVNISGATGNVVITFESTSDGQRIRVDDISLVQTHAAASITAAGLATFVADVPLDYTSVVGLEAYIATTDGSTITLTKKNKIAAGTGVLLRATAGGTNFTIPVTTATTDATTGNLFVRGTGAAVATGSNPYNYVLGKKGDDVGFYKANGAVVAANKAYLQTSIAAARIGINFDDEEATAIIEVKDDTENSKVTYSLAGQRVANPTKGLYIVNGKKVIIK